MFADSQDLIDKSKDVHAPLFIESVSNKFVPIDSKAIIHSFHPQQSTFRLSLNKESFLHIYKSLEVENHYSFAKLTAGFRIL